MLVSNAHTFAGHLEPWLRPRQLKVLPPAPPEGLLEHYRARNELPAGWQGFARILDVERIQADDDDDEELLICGDDAFGGWVAIAHVDEARAARGANPFGAAGTVQAVRTAINRGFEGDPEADRIPNTYRDVPGVHTAPTSCAFVRDSPMGPMILSFGRPGSGLYPGLGDLVATPVRAGLPVPTSQANLPQRRLAMRSLITTRAEELAWGEWRVGESVVRGPMVRLQYPWQNVVCRMGATRSGQGMALSAADCAVRFNLPARSYPEAAPGLDLTGTRFGALHRLRLRRGCLGGAPQPRPAAGRHRLGRDAGRAALWPAHALGGLVPAAPLHRGLPGAKRAHGLPAACLRGRTAQLRRGL